MTKGRMVFCSLENITGAGAGVACLLASRAGIGDVLSLFNWLADGAKDADLRRVATLRGTALAGHVKSRFQTFDAVMESLRETTEADNSKVVRRTKDVLPLGFVSDGPS